MKHFFSFQKAFLSTVFTLIAAGFWNFAAAQGSVFQSNFEAMPEAQFFPNPVAVGDFLKLKIQENVPNERAVFSVKILDEKGQTVFAAEMPDELELLMDRSRFAPGLFIAQFYENGRLFEQDELIVR